MHFDEFFIKFLAVLLFVVEHPWIAVASVSTIVLIIVFSCERNNK